VFLVSLAVSCYNLFNISGREKRMLNSIAETCTKNCRHIVSLCGVDCYVVDTSTKNFASGDWKTAAFCGSCGYIKCTPQATHSYGCNEAFRWGGSYTFYCPLGLVMVACSLKDETGALLGGITAGPILVGNMEDLFDVTPDIKKIPFIETVKEYSEEDVTHLEKLIEAVSVFSLSQSQQKSIAESSAGVALGEPVDPARVSVSAPGSIPARYEEELRQLMSDKNKDAAQKLIDKLVTHIFLRCDMQLSAIKPQVAELFSLLSRVSADAGFQMR